MWTIIRKEVLLKVIDGKPVKYMSETDTGDKHTIKYLALDDSTTRNVDAPSNVAYVAEWVD